MKQTAVEWLDEQLQDKMFIEYGYSNGVRKIVISIDAYMELKQQAKEMEKEQLCYFYIKGVEAEMNNPYVTNIEFYNKTFKKTEQ